MNFTDSQLKECYERNYAEVSGFSDGLRQVCALIAAHDFFQMLEGPHSVRVHETIEQLLLPGLRPGLREWFRLCSAEMNPAAIGFREQLSHLAGERLEIPNGMLLNPS